MRPADLLARELSRDGSRPLVTWYDHGTGERVELSVATVANWAAKLANHLVDELAVAAGDEVTLTDPLHWLAPVCLLGSWTAGASLGPNGEPIPGEDPAAFQRAVLAQPDVLLVPTSPTEVAEPPYRLAGGARVLSVRSLDEPDGQWVLGAALASGGSVVLVRNADTARLAKTCGDERVTATLGVDVSALPRLDT